VNEGHAAEIGGGRETRHVADHAAAERDHRRGAVGVEADEGVVDARDRRQLLEALAVGNENRLAGDGDGALQAWAMKAPHRRARDDEAAWRHSELVEQRGKTIEG